MSGMQQPMNQQDPIGGQQAMSQQMVLCPVRFVYETQVLVQPGDQIQPNQTFFINPQNPPPWMQNRPAQNAPVVYVQQLQNNAVVPSVQQHMDQNQLYLQQNLANFQLQQHMLAQSAQEIRPTMQIANIMPNMVQNIQQPITNDRNPQNTQVTQQMQANTQQMIQNQINAANVRQVGQQISQQINQPMNQTVEVQRQVFMNMRPQMNQQVQINNLARPVMSLNQFQNMQALANIQNVQLQQGNVGQTFVHTIGPRPIAQNVNTVRPQTVANNMNVQQVAKIRELPPQEANKPVNVGPTNNMPTVTNNSQSPVPNVRNFGQNYNRPIQPRRRYVQQTQTATPQKVQSHIPVQNISTLYSPQPVQMTEKQMASTSTNTTYMNPNINRKRKSESPDEMKNTGVKTMAVINNNVVRPNYIMPQQNVMMAKVSSNEVGTNTSPIHRPKLNVNANAVAYQNPVPTPMVVTESIPVKNEVQIQNVTEQKIAISPLVSAPLECDKLVRNTVFTQARGRVLQAENVAPAVIEVIPKTLPIPVVNPQITQPIASNTATIVPITPPVVQNITEPIKNEIPKDIPKVVEQKTEKSDTTTEAQTAKSKLEELPTTEIKKIETPQIKPEVISKTDSMVTRSRFKMEVDHEIKTKIDSQVKEESKEEIQAKEEIKSEVQEEKVEEDKKTMKVDILTHVVDGYVIQESSFAFPIRKPLKEKTLFTNPKAEDSELPDALKECMKEEMKTNTGDIPLLPFHYLLLNEKKEPEEKKVEEEQKAEDKEVKEEDVEMKVEAEDSGNSNPFAKLQHATVKSWTVEDLSSHLHKFDWKETVSVLQDHEIDGESLFLVSKTQLMTIGVNEDHAEVICEFVRS